MSGVRVAVGADSREASENRRECLRGDRINQFTKANADRSELTVNPVGATEKAAAALVNGVSQTPKDALGRDYNGDGRGVGYNVQSLLGAQLTPPYMHNGACESIACVVGDAKHRTGNGRFADVLDTAAKRNQVRLFVESIDATTTPF